MWSKKIQYQGKYTSQILLYDKAYLYPVYMEHNYSDRHLDLKLLSRVNTWSGSQSENF